jgi:hypothetical protein
VAVAVVSLAVYVLALRLGTMADRRLPDDDRPISRWYSSDMPAEDAEGQYVDPPPGPGDRRHRHRP